MKYLICILLLIGSVVKAETYQVATWGDDTKSGLDSANAWRTWGKAFSTAIHGDLVFFRGGTYTMSVASYPYGYRTFNSGTLGDTIRFVNYPGEVPILDCNGIKSPTNHNYGINTSANYIHIKGLVIKNVWQSVGYNAYGFYYGGSHAKFENCTAYNIHGAGFWAQRANDVKYINCDAFECCDSLTTVNPGNDGYGFMSYNTKTYAVAPASLYYYGCRAWNCGDDGFQSVNNEYTEWINCWSFNNGRMLGAGNGFKLGLNEDSTGTGVQRLMRNCLAINNKASGVTTNDNLVPTKVYQVYNNSFYLNKYGISVLTTSSSEEIELLRDFKNNLSYLNWSGVYIKTGAWYTHDGNSWDEAVNITASDFVSLDTSFLNDARDVNGALPSVGGFLELASTSDLIDKGVDVGLPYKGFRPDIGYFEYNSPNPPDPPVALTLYPSNHWIKGATLRGIVIDDGGGNVSDRGLCWSTDANPDQTDNHVHKGSGLGVFYAAITGLLPNTTYHVRVFCVNEAGTDYGDDISFTTPRYSPLQNNGNIVRASGKTVIIK
jgi:hypothetical protein